MKCRIIALLLIFSFVLSFAACASEIEEATQEAPTEAATEAETQTEEETEEIVFVSKSGHKIHRSASCSGMKHYWRMTYKEAREKGYKICSKCY